MHHKLRPFAADFLLAAVTGIVAAVTILPFALLAIAVMLAATVVIARSRRRQQGPGLAAGGVIITLLVFSAIPSAAAYYRPAKTVNQLLQNEVTLPSQSMTLAELAYLSQSDRQAWPIGVSFHFADDDQDLAVQWRQERMTLDEFVTAIESQTDLRAKFMHCGNGYTILHGGDCCFGLMVRDPSMTWSYEGKAFDLYEYAALRSSRQGTPGDAGQP